MLHRVAKISKHFQGSPIYVGDSTQHERNMELMRDHTLDTRASSTLRGAGPHFRRRHERIYS